MNILVLNAGSSTLKFELIHTSVDLIAEDADERRARGDIERIGGEAVIRAAPGDGPQRRRTAELRDIESAVQWTLRWLVRTEGTGIDELGDIRAVGHRVVHGGERFRRSTLVDDQVLEEIEEVVDLAPLHNPHNIRGIEAIERLLGDVPQAAVFDTAFHHSLPEKAYLYGIPYSYYRRYKIRRYGFHGTSHRYVAHRWRQLAGRDREETNLITLHLGSGASACAIRAGKSVDTSMGFTPLEGLVMGTRSGDVDPAILDFLAAKEGFSSTEVQTVLNKQSGLLGISGLTNDMRELLEEAREKDDRRARLAIEIFAYRARKYVGSYLAAMGGADALVFTGGIGENVPVIREMVAGDLGWMGLELDPTANDAAVGGEAGRISTDGSRLHAWVIPTDEELLIARDTARLVEGAEPPY